MDEKNRETSAAKSSRTVNLFALRLAVAAYLVYLGFWGCGVGFMAAGLGFGIYSLLRYRRETAAEKNKTEETGKTPEEE